MGELRGAQRLRAAGFRTLQDPAITEPAVARLAEWLSEHAAQTFETADAAEVVDAAIRQLEFALEANRKFCEINTRLDRVVTATVQALKAEGYMP